MVYIVLVFYLLSRLLCAAVLHHLPLHIVAPKSSELLQLVQRGAVTDETVAVSLLAAVVLDTSSEALRITSGDWTRAAECLEEVGRPTTIAELDYDSLIHSDDELYVCPKDTYKHLQKGPNLQDEITVAALPIEIGASLLPGKNVYSLKIVGKCELSADDQPVVMVLQLDCLLLWDSSMHESLPSSPIRSHGKFCEQLFKIFGETTVKLNPVTLLKSTEETIPEKMVAVTLERREPGIAGLMVRVRFPDVFQQSGLPKFRLIKSPNTQEEKSIVPGQVLQTDSTGGYIRLLTNQLKTILEQQQMTADRISLMSGFLYHIYNQGRALMPLLQDQPQMQNDVQESLAEARKLRTQLVSRVFTIKAGDVRVTILKEGEHHRQVFTRWTSFGIRSSQETMPPQVITDLCFLLIPWVTSSDGEGAVNTVSNAARINEEEIKCEFTKVEIPYREVSVDIMNIINDIIQLKNPRTVRLLKQEFESQFPSDVYMALHNQLNTALAAVPDKADPRRIMGLPMKLELESRYETYQNHQ